MSDVNETASPGTAHAVNGAAADKVVPPSFLGLSLGSVGVVYGDIGTSPLYAFREAVIAASPDHIVNRAIVLGVLSLIVWSLIVVVTIKYVLILLRADNNGEGGTLSLTALATRALGRRTAFVFILGIIGASMFLGDSVITPAISVLSAVEGLKLATPAFSEVVAPLTVIILIGLFAAQSRGTAKVAALFGPIMVVWFVSIAIAGALHILDDPHVLLAINPFYGIAFFYNHGEIGLVTLGAVFLVVTGGEALYADLGHFGRKPIQTAWLSIVLPTLLINYFGQGAKVLADPGAIENPFYRLVPDSFLLPMVVLATAATVIASQAVITGAYSLVHQAIQLGLLPRLAILHTSASHVGQIYIPRVTISLLVGVLLLVAMFRTSSALASAYGIAVATTMVVDGLLGFIVVWKLWQWPLWRVALMMLPLSVVDLTFFSSNFLKLFEGAWAPILFGASMVLLILTWRRGTGMLVKKTRRTEVPIDTLFRSLEKKPPHIVPGTAVFLTSDPDFAPTVAVAQSQAQQGPARTQRHPHHHHRGHPARAGGGAGADHAAVETFRARGAEIRLHGIAQRAQGAGGRAQARLAIRHHVDVVFLSRRSLKPSAQSGMPQWQDHLFIALARSASDATDFFQIPTGRVVEVGTQVTI